MKIILATGIYPPDIGGPATYVRGLAEALAKKNVDVTVITYGNKKGVREEDGWKVVTVPKAGPILRWLKYANALQKHAWDADIVEAFSSVSAGKPLKLARLTRPKKILRLGGDFFWERYTARGGMKSLRQWYEKKPLTKRYKDWILRTFDHVVFSTQLQEKIYEDHYRELPKHSVIENSIPKGERVWHQKHEKFRVLFMGRFVGFKNLLALVEAVRTMNDVQLMFVGSGPLRNILMGLSGKNRDRILFKKPVHGTEQQSVFAENDLLIIPSVTEISPNVALEARAAGLPVLLTEKTGLSVRLSSGMTLAPLITPEEIREGIYGVRDRYDKIAEAAASEPIKRSWDDVANEHLSLFNSLL